ncbi:MAG TPA: LPP20 family lipoprotein [Elusimicrobiota bacterium]|nr:LPP20 family lipoprotein [Elusimicrobiota bacterium]
MKRICLGLLCIALSVTAASAAKKPAWITGADKNYPDQTFILGVGIGRDIDSARSAARAEISKVFQARVQQSVTDVQSEGTQTGGKKPVMTGSQSTEMKTRVATDGLLEGVQIAETWLDEKAKTHYALAVLDKMKMRAALSGQLTEIEEKMESYLGQAKAATSPLEKAKGLSQALKQMDLKEPILARKRIVDPSPMPDLPGSLSRPEIEKQLGDALGRIQFVVDAGKDDQGARIHELVKAEITKKGFKVSDTAAATAPESPVIVVKCRLSVEPYDRGNPQWKFFLWKGTFEMYDGVGGKMLYSSAPTGEEGHLTESGAQTKAKTVGEQALAAEAGQRISDYVFGQ